MLETFPAFLQTRFRRIPLTRTLWMGIVNATPDSFSDGGRTLDEGIAHAMKLCAAGADILDIGGESTRPGAKPISCDEEIARVLPLIREIRARCNVPLSIDTYHPETARAALDEGVEILNDITGAEQPEMLRLLQETGAAVCFMHSRKPPQKTWPNVVADVFQYLAARQNALQTAGIAPERMMADVGLGFHKTMEENWLLVRNIGQFHALGVPLLVGHSRKRFLSQLDPDRDSVAFSGTRDGRGSDSAYPQTVGNPKTGIREGDSQKHLTVFGTIF